MILYMENPKDYTHAHSHTHTDTHTHTKLGELINSTKFQDTKSRNKIQFYHYILTKNNLKTKLREQFH